MAEVKVTEHSGESVYIRTPPVMHCIQAWHVRDFAAALEAEGAPDDARIEFGRDSNTFQMTKLSCRFHRAPADVDSVSEVAV